jgi:phosphoglycolate phosphatase-like HAD superfamily hydrolase
LANYIETVVTADDVGDRHKPHPEPVHAALRALGQPHDQAVFVGDSPHDMVAGRDAGVATAAVAWGPFPRASLEQLAPDHWIDNPAELLALAPNGTPRGTALP